MAVPEEPSERCVVVDTRDGIARVELNRPRSLNAFNWQLWQQLLATLRELADDPGCRVVMLTGAGRAFSAGADVKEGIAADDPQRLDKHTARMRTYLAVIECLRSMPQPVIAAIHGRAIGVGFAVTCACDIRIAGPDAVLHPVFTRIGLSAGDVGLTWLLPRLIPPTKAAEILLTGREVHATEAIELGLALPAQDDVIAASTELADRIAGQPQPGVRATKELLVASLAAGGMAQHLQQESKVRCCAASRRSMPCSGAAGARPVHGRKRPSSRSKDAYVL